MPEPTTTIDALPSASTPLADVDLLIVQQSGVTKKVPAADVVAVGAAVIDDVTIDTDTTYSSNKIEVRIAESAGVGAPGEPGPPGDPGIVIDDAPPDTGDVLWADTETEGAASGGDTITNFVYTDESDIRPAASVVFWIPDPFNLGNPFGALPGDLVIRSVPDQVAGLNGVEAIWKGTAAEYAALAPDDNTVYFVYEPEAL
jgi:hypothetical protein